MTAIIWGANGQDGFYLKKILQDENIEVMTISRNGNHLNGDISNFEFVQEQIKTFCPDYVFHFAANSTTRHSALFDNHAAVSTGTINILEAIRKHAPACKIFLSGSAMQFKNDGLPINEVCEFDANSAYSVSRIHSVYAARYYRKAFNLKVYVGYFFNHDSPLRNEHHVNQKIAKAVLRIADGSNEKIELGNIAVKKEFGFAGDAVKAVWTLVNQEHTFETIIGTGKAYSIADWLDICFKTINRSWKENVILTDGFVAEYTMLVSDPSLINSLGWYPEVDIYSLARMMLK
jgi:GDPmannose 4,6-dehydratase